MVLIPSGNTKFDLAVAALESTHQFALKQADANQALARLADIAFQQGVIAAGLQFGMTTLAAQEALIELGVSPIPQQN